MTTTDTSTREQQPRAGTHRARWAAIGAAVAVAIGGGSLFVAHAADSAPGTFVGISPCRVVDTRPAPDNVGSRATPIGSGETYSTAFVGAVGKCNIPANAFAVVLSLVVVNPTGNSFLTVFPAGGAVPLASNLNFSAGQAPVANSATVQIGAGGQLSFFNHSGTVDVVADVSGYYLPTGSKTQEITFGIPALLWDNPGANGSINHNCESQAVGIPEGSIPLNLPVGAVINSISAVIYDSSTSSQYNVRLMRQRTSGTGIDNNNGNPLLEITGGGATNVAITGEAFSSSSFPVTATDIYSLHVFLGDVSTNAFCSAAVKVTMP